MRHPRTLTAAVFAAAALLTTLTVASTQATADPGPKAGPNPTQPDKAKVPAGFATWDDVYAFQTRLNAAADKILEADKAGNASVVADPTSHELVVYWKGTVPAAVRAAANAGVPVEFRRGAFTHRELVKEAQRITSTGTVLMAEPRPDAAGLAVTIPAVPPAADRTNAQAISAVQAASSVPLTVTAGTALQPLYNRQADTPLFWGGSAYGTISGSCTNGFPLKLVTNQHDYMITAGHCGDNGGSALISGQPFPTGTILSKDACRDTMLIDYPAGMSPSVYTGAYDSTSSAAVVGAAPDYVGNLVTTSGSSSGEHLNIPVKAVDVYASINGNPCSSVGPLTRAAYDNATCAAAAGDSGGPVYSYYTNSTVLARGTITAGQTGTATCPGLVTSGSNAVLYAPLARPNTTSQIGALSYYAANVLTCSNCVPPTVTVPDVVGDTTTEASAALDAVGLHIGSILSAKDYTCNNIGAVMNQTPSAGTSVLQGSGVTVTIGQMPPAPFQCP